MGLIAAAWSLLTLIDRLFQRLLILLQLLVSLWHLPDQLWLHSVPVLEPLARVILLHLLLFLSVGFLLVYEVWSLRLIDIGTLIAI